MTQTIFEPTRLALAAWLTLHMGAVPVAAVQEPPSVPPPSQPARLASDAGTIVGRVLDGASGQPVPSAVVTLELVAGGLLPDMAGSGAGAVRTVVTGESGAYRFTDVIPGAYRLRVERLGYRGVAVDVHVRRAGAAGVSIGLELAPVTLEPMRVAQRAAPWFARSANLRDEPDQVRRLSEQQRQSLFLSSDTRVLTYADVMDGVTLGEGDVFRALQRFAGVGTRDDYTAELWTRGAPWTQTRVMFDGVPLFNPVHAVGLLSAVTPEVLGSVLFHPGVRPAAIGEGAAGVVDLRSRPGGGSGAVRGVADVSMASAKAVLEQSVAERGSWIVAARRSHLGVLTGGVGWLGLDTLDLPYVFHDIAARVDVELGRGLRMEASGLTEEDRLEGDVAGVLERTHARWGNTAGRVALQWSGRATVTQSIGASRFSARVREHTIQERASVPSWTEPASRNEIEHVQIAGTLGLADSDGAPRWGVGYDVAFMKVRYDGSFPRHHAVKPDTTQRLEYARDMVLASLWSDMRLHVGRLTMHPGVRLETGDEIMNADRVRVSPRVVMQVLLSAEQTASVSAGRTWQHTQSIALAGPSIHPAFHASHFWIWSDARTPAIRADIVNIGTERWLGAGWLSSVNMYTRRATGLTLPDPAVGRLGRRPLFVHGESTARGIELSLRRIGARWSTAAGYTHGTSHIEIDGERYPSAADRRHVFDAMAGVRVWRGMRVAAAYTSMSGAPFTRAYSRSPEDCTSFGFGCDNPTGSYVEAHNAERTPAYRSLDLSLQATQRFGATDVSGYVQLRNALGRDNASTYAGSAPTGRVQTPSGPQFVWHDRFEQGLPRLPLAGLRLTF